MRLIVSPSGPLAYVPFSLLLPGADITCVPSGSTAVQLADQAKLE